MQILTKSTVDMMRARDFNNSLIDGSYLHDESNRYTRFIIENLMGKDPECWDILNISSGIWKVVVDSYVAGVGEMKSDIAVNTSQIMRDMVTNGISAMEIISDGTNKTAQIIPSDEFFIIDGIPTRLRYIKIKTDIDKPEENYKYYLFRKRYFIGYNTNDLFEVNKGGDIHGKQIPLDTIADTAQFQEREET